MPLHDEALRRDRLLEAQHHAVELFEAVGASDILRPGVLESDASDAIRDLAAARFGMPEHWHRRIVRSGPNTLRIYREEPPDRRLTDDDIVFADFGPLFEGWEADFGRTWVLGDDPDKLRLREDLQDIFDAGRAYFEADPQITSEQLHAEILRLTAERGWEYGNGQAGHLVGEFPHENFDGERLDSYITAGNSNVMRRLDPTGRVAHWILEIHLVDRERQIGGFFEELLTI
ncbi:MAG: peptidase [Ilumatobacteraceae bacterium]|nr:peptidase [Ilumatobacteraceae bacterium]